MAWGAKKIKKKWKKIENPAWGPKKIEKKYKKNEIGDGAGRQGGTGGGRLGRESPFVFVYFDFCCSPGWIFYFFYFFDFLGSPGYYFY